jgi:MSHA biogenesis protein MshK
MSAANRAAALLAFAGCLAAPALGQPLRDPTEPPAFLDGAAPEREADPAGPVLQSVIVSQGRRLALIDGKTYRLGDQLGDATVAAISSNEVSLRGSGGTRVLRLYPDLGKAAGSGPPPAAGRAKERP